MVYAISKKDILIKVRDTQTAPSWLKYKKPRKIRPFFEIFSRCGQNHDAVREITTTKSMKAPSMEIPEGDQTTAEGLGVGVLQTDSPRMEIPEGDQTTAEGLGVGAS